MTDENVKKIFQPDVPARVQNIARAMAKQVMEASTFDKITTLQKAINEQLDLPEDTVVVKTLSARKLRVDFPLFLEF